MGETYVNIHGRKPTRGVRPWLLIPKVICVAIAAGGLASTLTVWLISGFDTLDKSDPNRLWIINLVANLLEMLVVPALLGAIVFGVALFLQHPRPFVRLRWLQVKLIGLAMLVPSAHFYCSSRLQLLRDAFTLGTTDARASRQFAWGLAIALAGLVCVMILGRLKPRLGQNWARSFPTDERG